MNVPNPVFVELVRGPVIESRHRASIAVADAGGAIVQSWGDISQVILPRSGMKPLQAIGMVESGAMEALGLSDAHLALHCASHSGEHEHVRQVSAWLDAIGLSEDDLECAPHRPLAEQWLHLSPGECPQPSRLVNNCSGKHAGFMSTAIHMGQPVKDYTSPDHPVQVMTRELIAELTNEPASSMPLACDNCGAPVYGVAISALAVAAAKMACPRELDARRSASIERVVTAMRRHPFLVAGTGRADTVLMEDDGFTGATKCGAEGIFMAILPDQALGVAIKVDDGANRAADAVLVELLHHLGALDGDARERLAARLRLTIHNPRGELISDIRVVDDVLSRQKIPQYGNEKQR
jgi:L-asparaginase II